MLVRDLGSSCPFRSLRFIHLTPVFLLLFCLFLPAFAGEIQDIQNVNTQAEPELMKQGEKAFRKADLDLAESTFRQVLDINKYNVRAKLRLSHVLLKKRQRLVEAYNYAFEVGMADHQNAYAYALAGNILLAAGDFKAGAATLNAAVKMDSYNALAIAGLGMLDFYENRLEDSLDKLAWATFKDPNEPDYLLFYAQVSARLEKFKQAAVAYRRFLIIAPELDAERRDRIRGLINFLDYLGNKSTLYEPAGKDQTAVPIEIVNDRPIIHMRIGKNDEELRFVIDTGSNISVISQKTADRLKIRAVARGGSARGVGGTGKFEIVYGFLSSISIGDVKIRNVPVYLRQFPAEIGKYDGYIGLALISKFLTTIDFGNNTLSISKRRSDDDAAPQPLGENEFISYLRLTPSGFLSGEVTLPGIELPLNFIVDTGAELSVISTELAEREGVKQFERDTKMRVIGAAGVTEGVPLFRLPSVSFGKHSLADVRAIALNLSVINENAGFEQSGILGGNFLRHYRLTFDFQNYTLSFSPIKLPAAAKE
jgi:predicted aspartyl protease